ncbi:OsmC family peroxiredoxin [Candidatus Thorarchaeota archaeon]|nr:MAG: OsmC family peroxiredoxin [Candidatus Thorarchaeota archaeon]
MRLKTKYPEKIEYHSVSMWDGKTGGTVTVYNNRKVVYDTPETYGGRGAGICPDELFVSAVLGCLNNTFLDFQRRFEMDLKQFSLEGTATAVFDGTGYKITGVSISGEVIVGEDEIETGKRCIELMKEYCHITRTVKDCLPFEYDISIREE